VPELVVYILESQQFSGADVVDQDVWRSLKVRDALPGRRDAFVERRQVGAVADHARQSLVFYVSVKSLEIAVHREDRNALFREPAHDVTADARRGTCDVSSLALKS
jgi:hypothetical protein